MKQVAIAAAALILGLMLGGLQPRAEVRDLREELTQAEPAPANPQLGKDLADFFGGSGPRGPRQPCLPTDDAISRPERIAAAHPEAVELVEELDAELEIRADEFEQELLNLDAPDEETLALARTALDLRRAQSRAALVQDTDPSEEQLEAIDGAYEQMNDVLVDLSGELVDMLADGRTPTRRDAMVFTAEALDAMLLAEESIEALLDDEQRGELQDDALNPFNYIDPSIVDALRELDQIEL